MTKAERIAYANDLYAVLVNHKGISEAADNCVATVALGVMAGQEAFLSLALLPYTNAYRKSVIRASGQTGTNQPNKAD